MARNNAEIGEYDGYDMRLPSEMTAQELKEADVKARIARVRIFEELGLLFPTPEEAKMTGSYGAKKVSGRNAS